MVTSPYCRSFCEKVHFLNIFDNNFFCSNRTVYRFAYNERALYAVYLSTKACLDCILYREVMLDFVRKCNFSAVFWQYRFGDMHVRCLSIHIRQGHDKTQPLSFGGQKSVQWLWRYCRKCTRESAFSVLCQGGFS